MPKRQEELEISGPGVAPQRFKDIDRAADSLQDLLEQRAKLSEGITAAEKKVLERMDEHQLTTYKYRDQEVKVDPGKIHVKIKTVKAQGVDGAAAAADAADEEAETR